MSYIQTVYLYIILSIFIFVILYFKSSDEIKEFFLKVLKIIIEYVKVLLKQIKFIKTKIHFDAFVHYGTIVGTAYIAAHAHPNNLNDYEKDDWINPYISTFIFVFIYISTITFDDLERRNII